GRGSGSPRMAAEWCYGSRTAEMAARSTDGRPNRMPTWRNQLTVAQICKLCPYVSCLPRHPRFFFILSRPPPRSTLFPYTTLFRSLVSRGAHGVRRDQDVRHLPERTLSREWLAGDHVEGRSANVAGLQGFD